MTGTTAVSRVQSLRRLSVAPVDSSGNGIITGPEIMEEFLLTGVKTIKQEPVDDGLTRVYDMQGRLVHTAPTATFNLWKVPARGVLVVKQGNTVRKVAR